MRSAARKTKRRHKNKKKQFPVSPLLTISGSLLIVAAVLVLAATFAPALFNEINYLSRSVNKMSQPEIIPVDTQFGIVVSKIGANSKIIADIDPYDSRIYQAALSRGVAHAKGTAVPGTPGNVFLFSHSSVNFYEATRYNSVFYLLTKLEFGDVIDLYYQGKKYTYQVTSKQIVGPREVQYLKSMNQERQTVTLMTCWPPGTTLKRLIVIGELL